MACSVGLVLTAWTTFRNELLCGFMLCSSVFRLTSSPMESSCVKSLPGSRPTPTSFLALRWPLPSIPPPFPTRDLWGLSTRLWRRSADSVRMQSSSTVFFFKCVSTNRWLSFTGCRQALVYACMSEVKKVNHFPKRPFFFLVGKTLWIFLNISQEEGRRGQSQVQLFTDSVSGVIY